MVSLTDPSIFTGLSSVKPLSIASKDRSTIGRLCKEIYIMISTEGSHSSGVNWPMISRLSVDDIFKRTLADIHRISTVILPMIARLSADHKQKRSTEGCSKFKSPETRQVQERLVSTLEHMQVPKSDRTRCPEE